MDRTTVLPPLVHAALDVRDRIPWGPPTEPSDDGLSTRTADVSFCDGVVARLSVDLSDVHASVFAVLFSRDINHADIMGDSTAPFSCDPAAYCQASKSGKWLVPHGPDATQMEELLFLGGGEDPKADDCPPGFPDCHPSRCPIVERESLTYFSSETPKHRTRDFVVRMSPIVNLSLREHVSPASLKRISSADRSEEMAAGASRSSEDKNVRVVSAPTPTVLDTMSPRSPQQPSLLEASAARSNVHDVAVKLKKESSSSFVTPDATPSKVPVARSPGDIDPSSGIYDIALAREAAGLPPGHAEAYAFAACSCSGAIPAVKRAVRSGMLASIVVSSETSETVGCHVDFCYVFHATLPVAVVTREMREDLMKYIEQAQFLTTHVFGGQAVDIEDRDVITKTVMALRRKRLAKVRAAAVKASGFGCECCVVQ